jgi:hypothetical protein
MLLDEVRRSQVRGISTPLGLWAVPLSPFPLARGRSAPRPQVRITLEKTRRATASQQGHKISTSRAEACWGFRHSDFDLHLPSLCLRCR